MPNMMKELNEGMIQDHMDPSPRYITKLAWQDIHEEGKHANKRGYQVARQNDMDEQHVITTRGQP
jgi:hypothetical protein